MNMKWTREKPNVRGYYWLRVEGKDQCIRYVCKIAGMWIVSTSDADGYDVDLDRYSSEIHEWSGPIPEPTE
jgi:hypothetical protein